MMPHARRKVLIAVDMSGWAEYAFDWYVSNCHLPNTEVICFHTIEPPWVSSGEAVGLAGEAYALALEGCQTSSKAIEDKFIGKMKANSIGGRMVVKFASKPGEAIVDTAAVEGVTMVVMGTRGLGKIRRTIMGSVSDYVLHHIHCPVAICSHNKPRREWLSL